LTDTICGGNFTKAHNIKELIIRSGATACI
jgi:hypothetical protein